LIEGGPSKNHEITKALMHSDPETWHALMKRLVPTIINFLDVQIEAGIDAMQLFDSWAGYLNRDDYREYVLPYSTEILEHVAGVVPRIHFGVGTGELLPAMAEAGSEVRGVDYRVRMDEAAERIHAAHGAHALQGNLDPALLFAGDDAVRGAVRSIRDQVATAQSAGHATGHIRNVGLGVLPAAHAQAVTLAVGIIHEEGYMSIAIVGAGLAGLATVYELRGGDLGADAHIDVFEASDRIGGKLFTVPFNDGPVDLGAEAFLARREDALEFFTELGLADSLVEPSGKSSLVYSQSNLQDLPRGGVMGIPSTSAPVAHLVSEETVRRIDAENDAEAIDWTVGEDRSIGQLVRERYGDEVVDRIVSSLLGGVYSC